MCGIPPATAENEVVHICSIPTQDVQFSVIH